MDLTALRHDTPGCSHRAHLNSAGSALTSRATLDAMVDFLALEAREGGYDAALEAGPRIEDGRAAIAELIGAAPREIAYATSDTQAFLKAFWGLVQSGWFRAGDVIAVDALSYNSHQLALLQAARTHALRIELVRVASELPARTRLVAYTQVGTHSGRVHDLAGVAEQTRARGIPFFVDACQSVGQIDVDVRALGCDVLTATGRKWLRGPRGSGFLYVASDWIERLEPLGIDGHSTRWLGPNAFAINSDATRFEEFEVSIAAKVGLAAAVRQALALGPRAIHARIAALADYTRQQLAPLVTLCDGDARRSGIVTFRHATASAAQVTAAARARGVTVWTSTPAWIDATTEPQPLVRSSAHVYNTEADIDRLVEVVAALH